MNTPANIRAASSTSGCPLISKERMQKLDLLNHLIENLANTIIICGPDGIGKTRLLKVFREEWEKSAKLSWVDGNSNIRLETVQESLSDTIAQNWPDLKAQSLTLALDRINSRSNKIVLIIDNAGLLAPGIIKNIIEYANLHPALRLILVLTQNELYIKNGTDPVVEDCYQIEIPPLSQQQCEDFLEYLSTLPDPRIDFNTINENRVAEIYRETHGIPGRILSFLPKPAKRQIKDYSKPVLIAAVMGLVLIVLGVQWWSANQSQNTAASIPSENKEESSIASAQGQPKKRITDEPKPAMADASSSLEIMPTQGSAGTLESKDEAGRPSQVLGGQGQNTTGRQPASKDMNQPGGAAAQTNQGMEQNKPELAADASESERWLAAQPADNFSLQLMALSKEEDILEVIGRYPELKPELRYIKTKTRRGYDRFILFYGSFTGPEQLSAQRQALPKELKQVWIRKIADIQKDLISAEPVPAPIP